MDLNRVGGKTSSGAGRRCGRSVAWPYRGEAGHHVGEDGVAPRVRIH